jgi:Ca2+-binding RTX toxin-like protein
VGGQGSDRLIGGKSRDVFVLERGPGRDVIQDFTNGLDRLAIEGVNPRRLEISQKGRNTLISFGRDDLAILIGVQANQITAQDFIRV